MSSDDQELHEERLDKGENDRHHAEDSPRSPRRQPEEKTESSATKDSSQSSRDGSFPYDRPDSEPSTVLALFNLGEDVKLAELEAWISKEAPIVNTSLPMERNSTRPRGYAFITFATIEDATKVKSALHKTEFNGRPVRIDYSTTPKPHEATPGRYMGHRTSSRREHPYHRDSRDYDRDPYDYGRRGSRYDRYERDSYSRRSRYDDNDDRRSRDRYDDRGYGYRDSYRDRRDYDKGRDRPRDYGSDREERPRNGY